MNINETYVIETHVTEDVNETTENTENAEAELK